jgi:hypothetical protein
MLVLVSREEARFSVVFLTPGYLTLSFIYVKERVRNFIPEDGWQRERERGV